MRTFKDGQPWSYLRSLCLIVCVGTMGGAMVPAQARSLADILATKEIRFCAVALDPAELSVEPADCREHCRFSGYYYEIALAFVENLGSDVKPKFLRVEWDEQFFNHARETVREDSYTPELLASGTCDVYPSQLAKNAWRLKKLDFVTLFVSREMVLVHKSRKSQFNTATDLCGKVAATAKDTTMHTWLQEQNTIMCATNPIHLEFVNVNDVTKGVEERKVDFSLEPSFAAIRYTRHRFKNVVVAFAVGLLEEVGWRFRKVDTDLQAAVQTFFETQRATPDSILNTIWTNYLGMTLIEFISLMTSTAVK